MASPFLCICFKLIKIFQKEICPALQLLTLFSQSFPKPSMLPGTLSAGY